jgi:hypothetical protein
MFEKQMETMKAQYQTENGETMDINAEVIGDVNDINIVEAELVTPEVEVEN